MSALSQSDLYQSLRPAERVAALTALKDALEQQIKVEKVAALALATELGVKSFSTEFGNVNVSQKDEPIIIDEVELLAYVKENTPEIIETVEQVPDWYAKELSNAKNLVIVDSDVYNADGEQLPFATVGDKPAPYITWPASKGQKAGKAQAVEFVHGAVGALSAGVLGMDVDMVERPAKAITEVTTAPPAPVKPDKDSKPAMSLSDALASIDEPAPAVKPQEPAPAATPTSTAPAVAPAAPAAVPAFSQLVEQAF